jgi:hypothetical protein
MTVQVGWIGGRERPVRQIVDVFKKAETRDENNGSHIIRSKIGQSYVALDYQRNENFSRTYDFLDNHNSLDKWADFRLSNEPTSNLVMATMTRAANMSGHSKIPAVTYREVEGNKLIIGTTGSATQCAKMLGVQSKIGDTEDITDWVVAQGIENISNTLDKIVQIPANMHMVFTLIDPGNHITTYLLRSRQGEGGSSGQPYLAYSFTDNALAYASLPEEAENLIDTNFKQLEERSVTKLTIT